VEGGQATVTGDILAQLDLQYFFDHVVFVGTVRPYSSKALEEAFFGLIRIRFDVAFT
jgi:hypothetical protein